MMHLSEASDAMQGQLMGADAPFESVEIDTRRAKKSGLFFAIHGEQKNGHEFINVAHQAGALASVVDEPQADELLQHIMVDDTTIALGMLAAHWRRKFNLPVVGITGSNGKTTVSNIVKNIFDVALPGIAPQGSFNNHWGVPLTLLKLRAGDQSAVIEMGMNHAGELSYLGKIVQPTIGLITNAAAAHLEGLKTVEGVANAKGELLDFIAPNGTAILNRDDDF
ncbi:MAG: UDP-N-acetylmuramoyl-tripeptide--D-alanyl-D-alanine ligase, partial [Arenicellales bacterium]